MPTIPETIRLHAGLWVPRDRSARRAFALGGVLLVGVILLVPPLFSIQDPPLGTVIAGIFGPTLGSVHREYRYGGTAVHVLVAGITAFVISVAVVTAILIVWSLIGGVLSSVSPFGWYFSLPVDVQITGLLGLMALLVVLYFVTKPRRQRVHNAFEATVRAERIRRGLPTAP